MATVDCVFRYSDLETFVSKLSEMGVDTKPETDEEGNKYRIEERVGVVMTPYLVTIEDELACMIRLSIEQAELIPEVTSPEFLCDWKSDEYQEVEEDGEVYLNQLSIPEYDVNEYDIDGNVIGTRKQKVGVIG